MIDKIDVKKFSGHTITDITQPQQKRQLTGDLRMMNLCVLEAILSRFEQNNTGGKNYPFIDTKINIITGEDFPEDDTVAGRDRIFSWIQFRGLEAMVGHYQWIKSANWIAPQLKQSLSTRLYDLIEKLTEKLCELRSINNGRMGFVMSADGKPLSANDNIAANFSDIFGCKALVRAAEILGKPQLLDEALQWFEFIEADLQSDRFRSDQISLDPNNPAAKPVSGRHTHGPRMIFIGAAAAFMQVTGEKKYLDIALGHIEHITANYTNADNTQSQLHRFDMFEFTDNNGNPYMENGQTLRCDGGHACEFVGLSLKAILLAQKLWAKIGSSLSQRMDNAAKPLAGILLQNFSNSFSSDSTGMHKGFDLIARKPIGPDMPWWALPETFRAAIEATTLFPQYLDELNAVAAKSINAFIQNFINRNCHLMAYQTLGENARPVAVVPATPDADPGYHTGLSLIDALQILS